MNVSYRSAAPRSASLHDVPGSSHLLDGNGGVRRDETMHVREASAACSVTAWQPRRYAAACSEIQAILS